MTSAAPKGIHFQRDAKKQANTPVHPTRDDGTGILSMLVKFSVEGRDHNKLEKFLEGLNIETPKLTRMARALQLVAECGDDRSKIAKLYDKVNGTYSIVDHKDIVSIPDWDGGHQGEGFYTLELWEKIEWSMDEGEVWTEGWVESLVATDDGDYRIALANDPMAEVIHVPPHWIRRPTR